MLTNFCCMMLCKRGLCRHVVSVCVSVTLLQGVLIKSSPLKRLEYFNCGRVFLCEILQICLQFICTHISANFCRFILIFHQMALIFPQVPIVFTLSSSIHLENENAVYQLFANDLIFRRRVP